MFHFYAAKTFLLSLFYVSLYHGSEAWVLFYCVDISKNSHVSVPELAVKYLFVNCVGGTKNNYVKVYFYFHFRPYPSILVKYMLFSIEVEKMRMYNKW